MDRQHIDFMDWWARLNLALDDAGLGEASFTRALVIYKMADLLGLDLDAAIPDEVARASQKDTAL